MTPNPNLVVEALRNIADDPNRATFQVQRALPHAEAIAEMWPKFETYLNDAEELYILEASGGQEPAVQELIAAASNLKFDATNQTYDNKSMKRLRAALKPFEEVK